MTFDVTDYGVVDNEYDTQAFQDVIDACADSGGGTVLVPSGEYVTGELAFRSDITLHLAAGATLYPILDEDELGLSDDPSKDLKEGAFLLFDNVERVAITGRGVIDGRARELFDPENKLVSHHGDKGGLVAERSPDPRQEVFLDTEGETSKWPLRKPDFRPSPMVEFRDSENIRIRDVTFRDMPGHTISVRRSRDIVANGLTIDNDMRVPNTDGLAIKNSQDVHVSDCTIRAADDSISPNAAEDAQPTRNLTITNCTFQTHACAVKIGSGTAGDVRDVTVSNCTIESSTRGVGIQHRDQGTVENVLFSDLTIETYLRDGPWWGKAEPIYITSIPRREETNPGIVRNVRISNVVADAAGPAFVYASHGGNVEDIRIEGLHVEMTGRGDSKKVGGNFDLQPTSVTTPIYEHDVPALYCRGVEGLSVADLSVEWGDDRPTYLSHAVECEASEDVTLDGIVGGPAHHGETAIRLVELDGLTVRNSRAITGTGSFLELVDTSHERLFATTDCSNAELSVDGDHDFLVTGVRTDAD